VISVGGIDQLGEWFRFNNQGHEFPREYSFSPSFTMISVGGIAQLGQWLRLKNKGQLLFYAREEYSRYPMDDALPCEGTFSSRSHRCEWKNGPDSKVLMQESSSWLQVWAMMMGELERERVGLEIFAEK
jgi:hypothetical protein